MKFVNVYTRLEQEADEGGLHWPWVAEDRVELTDRVARARTAAREHVASVLEPSSPRRAGAKVRRTRRAAAKVAEEAVEGSDDA